MDGKVVIGTELDTKSFEAQIKQLESKLETLEKSADETNVPEKFRRSAEEARELNVEIEKTRNQLSGLYEKQAKINNAGFTSMKQSIDNIGNSMGNIIKKVAKWGLAIFGIRSVYLGIRQAISQIMQEDENLKWQIDYMKFAVGQAIKPVVEWIVNLVHQILVWLGAIIKILFGINIFANATQTNFKKANTNAKKLKKTLSGFDEMNILNEDGSTGIANSIGKALEGFGDISKQVDELADKLKPFEEEIKGAALLAVGIFGAVTIAKWIGNLSSFINGSSGLAGLSGAIATLAIAAAGIVLTITILKQTWDDINKAKKEVKEIQDASLKYNKEWVKSEKDLGKILDTNNVKRNAGLKSLKDSYSFSSWIYGIDKELLANAKNVVQTNKENLDQEMALYETEKLNRAEKEKILDDMIEQIKYNNEIKKALEKQGQETKWIDDINNDLTSKTRTIYQDIVGTSKALENSNGEATIFQSSLKKVVNKLAEVNRQRIEDKYAKVIMEINADTTNAEKSTNSWLSRLGEKIRISASKLYGAKGMLYTPPKLAVGGIINQPGRGVPIGSAYGGERGMEGVIPLTDSQQMALLGEAIGKYISVNITNVTELDGRQIARKVDKIQQNNNFVLNR